jgi:hypothetical protein
MPAFDQKIDIAHILIPEKHVGEKNGGLLATELSLQTDNGNANSGIVVESLSDTSAIIAAMPMISRTQQLPQPAWQANP